MTKKEGKQILTIRDYNKDEHPLLAVKKNTSELNGNEYLELTIHQQKNNNLDLLSIDKLWEIDHQNITYKIINIKKQTRGDSFYLTVNAKPLFYWEFSKSIIHENHDGSHTANSAFRTVFDGTSYNFVLVDFSPSVEIEGFGKGENRLELFKRLLDRYNYEFEIQGNTIYMRHMIGADTNYMYKYKLNASNVSSATDASGYFTHIKGFGDFDQGEEDYYNNAKLKREYTHPLADLVGKWEGPPIVDGRVNQRETLDAAMKKAVDESLQISIEGTLHDIRRMGYETAIPKKGDRVWLHDERINLEQEIRLYSIATTYNERDEITACDVTFGSQSIRERRKAELNSLSKNFRDLLTGQLKLPVISLEQIGMDMINAIHAASSEIIFGDFGMQAISKSNPNHVFGLNSEGWYISQDGGRTPRTIATAQGIYADALFAGTLWLTNDMNIESADGYLNVSGSHFHIRSKSDPNKYFEITPDGAMAHRGFIGVTRPDYYTDSSGKEYGVYMQDGIPNGDVDIQRNQFMDSEVTWSGQAFQLSYTNGGRPDRSYRCEAFYTSHKSKRVRVGYGLRIVNSPSAYLTIEVVEVDRSRVVASATKRVYDGENSVWDNLTFDIGVPDYSTNIAYYIRLSTNTLTEGSIALLSVNRVSLYG